MIPPADLPLEGVTVLDLSTSYAGPTAASLLADMGAEVTKVERSPEGDDTRAWGPPFVGGSAAWFHSANRGKRSIALDLRRAEDARLLEQLIGRSQVLIESFNPSKLAALDLEPAAVLQRHRGLIYCAISGFGFTGPAATESGYDLAAQARSGLMSVTGAAGGTPQRVSTALSDVATGIVAAFAVTAALRRLERTGQGEFVDVSLLDTDLTLMAPRIASFLAGEPEPRPSGGTDSVLAVYQAFETHDRPIVIAIGNDGLWTRFARVAGLEELAGDPLLATNAGRREARHRILPVIAERLKMRRAADWLATFAEVGIPAARVQSLGEVMTDPQVVARQAVVELDNGVRVVGPPWRFGLRPERVPAHAVGDVGADTEAILQQLAAPADPVPQADAPTAAQSHSDSTEFG
jgi:crotonobetainyl-CoA:carnitine CoA-transferase CaiB-like acyl-CoA transferase